MKKMVTRFHKNIVLFRRKRLLALFLTITLFMVWYTPLQCIYQIGSTTSSYMKYPHGRILMAKHQITDDVKSNSELTSVIKHDLEERIDGYEEIFYEDGTHKQSPNTHFSHQQDAVDDSAGVDLSGEFPYSYLINEREVCLDNPYIINIVPVKTADFTTRATIRMLWGNPRYYNLTGVRVVFILGISGSSKQSIFIQQRLLQESRRYRDIIQVNFIDSYRNLTLKTLSSLHWMKYYCPSAQWFLKSDADVFVNTITLKKLLETSNADIVGRPSRNNFVCRPGMCLSKYVVSYDEYAKDFYPPYCSGGAYAITTDMAKLVYNRANKTDPFVMEDAYFTGILVEDLQPSYDFLDHISFPFKVSQNMSRNWTGEEGAKKVFLLTKQGIVRDTYSQLWTKILYHSLSL